MATSRDIWNREAGAMHYTHEFYPSIGGKRSHCGTKVTVVSEQLTNGKSNKLCTKYCHIIQKEISCQLCPREHG
jgi:glutamine synthetase type III